MVVASGFVVSSSGVGFVAWSLRGRIKYAEEDAFDVLS